LLQKVTHAHGAYTNYDYDLHGRVTAQTGSADNPVRYTFDSTDGWMPAPKTHRDRDWDDNPLTGTTGNGSYESVTAWTYDAATGLLTAKTDAASKATSYTYDAIGNRVTLKIGSVPTNGYHGDFRTAAAYTRNALNQYTAIANDDHYDVNGLSASGSTIMVGDNGYEQDDADHFVPSDLDSSLLHWHRLMAPSSTLTTKATWSDVHVYEDEALKSSGLVRLPPEAQTLSYDDDGNLTADGTWTYTWDAENRLLAAELTVIPQGSGSPGVYRRITFAYDGLSRRIAKVVLEQPNTMSSWTQLSQWLYTWDGWNCVLRCYDDGEGLNWNHGYIWGTDLGGAKLPLSPDFLQSAGGVGGLLIENWNNSGVTTRRLIGYDGNGNVTTLADGSNGQLWALYEYDAFGNQTRHHNAVGSHADDNPFRFSTKPADDETGLVYYGYRYYAPGLGRWISRDPIGEWGGLNLTAGNRNDCLSYIDPTGLSAKSPKNPQAQQGPSSISWHYPKNGFKNGNCGAFVLGVKFELDRPSEKGGVIEQKVTREISILRCDGNPDWHTKDSYYEAWYVPTGQIGPVNTDNSAGWGKPTSEPPKLQAFNDNQNWPERRNTCGWVTLEFELTFYEGAEQSKLGAPADGGPWYTPGRNGDPMDLLPDGIPNGRPPCGGHGWPSSTGLAWRSVAPESSGHRTEQWIEGQAARSFFSLGLLPERARSRDSAPVGYV